MNDDTTPADPTVAGDAPADEPTLPGLDVGDPLADPYREPDTESAAPDTGQAGDSPPGGQTPHRHLPSAWPIWSWMMVGIVVLVSVVGVVGGILAPTVLMDVASFWPVFLVTFLGAAALFPRMRRASPRVSASVPLLLLTWLGLAIALHLSGWAELPSSAADLRGPEASGVTDAGLSFEIDGLARIGGQADALYEIALLRRGGSTGAPEAFEVTGATEVSIDVDERSDSGWFQSEGWTVDLAPSARWTLRVAANPIEADLAGLTLRGGSFTGNGVVRLGLVDPGSRITVQGTVRIEVDGSLAVTIEGDADVPSDWPTADGGWRSPVEGDPYVIAVTDGAVVTIVER
ncbi:MAG: hypothetical protein OEM32_09490 [Acidimicrobiia bacterium]|nr:hypothetical protein [Acidimicrobiia bacterium]